MNEIIYIFFLVFNLILIKASQSGMFSERFKKVFFVLFCLNVILFGCLRFDVGNDYYNYSERFYGIRDYDVFTTPDYFIFKLLTNLFSSFENGYIGVIGVYYIFTVILIIRFLKKKDALLFGFFTLVTFGVYFDILDRIRQLAALAIIIYSFDDIERENRKKFIIKVILASLFHISAIIILPFYYLAKINMSKSTIVLLYFIFIGCYFLGLWNSAINFIYDNIPYYNEIYRESRYYGQVEEMSTSLGFLGKTLFILLNILLAPIDDKLKTLLSMGLFLYIIGVGNLNIERVADYFLSITIYSFPKLIEKGFKNKGNKVIVVLPTVVFLALLYMKDINQEYFKYQTVFSEEYKYQMFKERVYE